MREIELRPRKRVLFQNREWAVTNRVVECIGAPAPPPVSNTPGTCIDSSMGTCFVAEHNGNLLQ